MPMPSRSTSLATALLLAFAFASAACGSTVDAPSTADDVDPLPGYFAGGTPPPQDLASAPLPVPGSPTPKSHGRGTFGAAGGKGAGTTTGDDTGAPDKTFTSKERIVAAKLGLPSRFIGLGNDADGTGPSGALAWGLAPKVDIHYAYLSNLDWPEWNLPAGNYVTLQANAAAARGVVPMFSLYQAAAWGENNLTAFNDTTFMTKYWRGVRIMFERLGAFGDAAIVHVEPDLWVTRRRRARARAPCR